MLLISPFFPALAIPVALLFCGSFARKLVRGSKWDRRDFYLGIEFTLAALTSALVYIFDIAKDLTQKNPSAFLPFRLAGTALFICVTLCLLLVVLSIHQEWEYEVTDRRGQIIWLCIVSNMIGAGLIASFVLFVKGLQ